MNKFKKLFVAVVTIMTACDGDTISPVSEKVQGPLSPYFEVVSKDYKANDSNIFIEFKRIKDGFPFPWEEGMKVGYSDGCFEFHFNVEFQDKGGNVVSKDDTDIVFDIDELKSVASLGVGESSTIRFDCNKGAKQFKVGSTFNVHNSPSSLTSYRSSSASSSGTPGRFPEGSDRLLSNADLDGYNADELRIFRNEIYARHGYIFRSADLIDHFSKESWYTGTNSNSTDVYNTFSDIEKKNLDLIKRAEATAPKFSTRIAGNISISRDGIYSSSDGKEWEKLLVEYEKLVNRFSSFADKAANGDNKAIAEYLPLMAEMAKLNEKIERMEDSKEDASEKQMFKLLELSNKLAEAEIKFAKAANNQMEALENIDLDDLLKDLDF